MFEHHTESRAIPERLLPLIMMVPLLVVRIFVLVWMLGLLEPSSPNQDPQAMMGPAGLFALGEVACVGGLLLGVPLLQLSWLIVGWNTRKVSPVVTGIIVVDAAVCTLGMCLLFAPVSLFATV